MPWLAAAAVAGPVISGMMGNAAAAKDRAAQKKAVAAALEELNKVGMPPDLSKALILQEFQSAGMYTPEMEEDLSDSIAESEVAKITADPESKLAQMQALGMMQQRAKVGLSAEDRASLNQVRQQVQTDSQAKQGQILQEMKARGMGGSGDELVARLQSAQMATDRASTASDQLMGQAQERALQALAQSGDFAGNMRQQDFNEKATKATALDERNRFLNENSIASNTRNTAARNAAQGQNLANKQSIMTANTSQYNTEKQRQNQAEGDYWKNKLDYGTAKSNAMIGQATQAGQQAQRTQDMYQGVGNSLGTAAGAYSQNQNTNEQNQLNRQSAEKVASYKASDENLKTNIEYTDEDVDKFLESLSSRIKRKGM